MNDRYMDTFKSKTFFWNQDYIAETEIQRFKCELNVNEKISFRFFHIEIHILKAMNDDHDRFENSKEVIHE